MKIYKAGDLVKIQTRSRTHLPWRSGKCGLIVCRADCTNGRWWRVMVGTDCDWVHEDLLVKIEENNNNEDI